ncbi:MAG: hypothetical protein Kow00123_14740 [Anaerolineales bacterium]
MSSGRVISVSAPASLCILGDPGDLFGGAVLACAVSLKATVEISDSPAFEVWANSQQRLIKWAGDMRLQDDEWDAARAALQFLQWGLEPVRIAYCTLPRGWGLGDSVPTLVALLRGLLAWRGKDALPHLVAEGACSLSHTVFGDVGGLAAAYMAAFGGLCLLDFRPRDESNANTRVYATVERLAPPVRRIPLVAAHRGEGRPARDALVGLRERYLAGERRVQEAYRIIDRLVHEGKTAVLEGDWERLGRLMNENAIIQSNLTSFDADSEELAEAALNAGAWGVRPVGVGEYGTIVALHPEPSQLAKIWTQMGAQTFDLALEQEGNHG